tara:strand:+ start:6096 stop:6221 length:126 start_codon:yes stop_codon:yes gene_type:complete
LLSEYTIFLFEIINHSLLLVIENAGNDDAEQLSRVKLRPHV